MDALHSEPVARPWRQDVAVVGLAAALVAGAFLFHGAVHFNVPDEGYLWEGVRRTLRGDVPLRDFNAYDPGRYYWCAAGARFFGDGILGLRLSASVFRFLGLVLGLFAARRVVSSLWGLTLVGLLLLAWNPTFYKTFEPSTALAAVYFGVRLIERPTLGRHFAAGVVAGLAAFVGRNLGLYTFAAYACLVVFLHVKQAGDAPLRRRAGAGLAGVVLGYSPLLLMLAVVPHFFSRFVEAVLTHFVLGRTNLPLPVPWPWTVDLARPPRLEAAVRFAVGVFFVLWPVFAVASLLVVWRTRPDQVRGRALFLASALVGLFYVHHAFARADYEHLAHVIPPLLLGLVALPGVLGQTWRSAGGALAATTLAGLTFVATCPYNFPLQFYRRAYPDWKYVKYSVAGDRLRIPTWQAGAFELLQGVVARHLPPGERLLIVPNGAGYYPVLGRLSPVWNTYFNNPELEARQRRMIREMEANRVGLVILDDFAADGREEYRFRNSQPLLWQYLGEHFHPVHEPALPAGWTAFTRNPSAAPAHGLRNADGD